MDSKTNLENAKMNCTVRDPPRLFQLPDKTSCITTTTAFFYTVTKLLRVA